MTQEKNIQRSMASEERCRLLARRIRKILQHGFSLTEDILHFIDSTFSTTSPDAVKNILCDETNSESETLLSLIFFPDIAMQMQLEDVLQATAFEPADEPRVLVHLISQPPETRLRFPNRPDALRICMPRWVLEAFVARLNIAKRLPADLAAAIDGHVPENRRSRVKVMLRNSRFARTQSRISFLGLFFEKLADDTAALAFMLALFEAQTDSPDIYEALIRRKRHCFKSVQTAKKLQKMLQTENMETLMLRGVRIPHVDLEEMSAQMRRIDRICLAIYGKTEYFPPPEQVLGAGAYGPG